MKNKKLLAAALMAMLVVSVIPCAALAAEDGETFVYKADFNKADEPFPTYEIGWTEGAAHTNKWVTSATVNGYPVAAGKTTPDDYSIVYGHGGKGAADGALKMYAPVKAAANNYMNFELPICTGVADSWTNVPSTRAFENAMSSEMKAGMQARWSFEIMKNDTADNLFVAMMYRGSNGSLQNINNAFGIDTGRNISFMAKSTGVKAELGKWYKIDVIFTYGSYYADFYINDELIVPRQQLYDNSTAITNGFKYFNIIQMKVKQSNNKAPAEVYLDNYEVSMLSGSAIKEPDHFNQAFNGYTGGNGKGISGANMSNGNYTLTAEKGVFGKSADDTSVALTIPENNPQLITNNNPYISYAPSLYTGWQYGDKIKIGMNIAFESADFLPWTYYITMRSISGDTNSAVAGAAKDGIDQILFMHPNKIIFGGNGARTTKEVLWVPQKWYHFDFVIEPGDGETIKNKISLYIDGEYIAATEVNGIKGEEYSQLNGVGNLRIAAQANTAGFIPGTDNSAYVGAKIYTDDLSFDKMAAETEITTVSVTADASITTGYKNALFIKNNETVGDMKTKVTVSGGMAQYVGANGTALDDAASAAGAYLKITANDGSVYYYNIVDKITWYDESFEDYEITADSAYKLTQLSLSGASSSSKTGVGAKSGKAYAFDYTKEAGSAANGPYLDCTTRESSSNAAKFPVADITTLEFSLFGSDDNIPAVRHSFDWTFETKDAEGTITNSGINGLISMNNGKIYAGDFWQSNKTYLCDYTNSRWYKFAFEINPKTCSADVYVNGEKKGNVSFAEINNKDFSQSAITGIMRLKMAVYYNASSAPVTGTAAFDGVKLYAGSYIDAARDAVTVSAPAYDMSHEGFIVVDGNNDDLAEEAFLYEVEVTGDVKTASLYDDASFAGKSEIEMNGVFNGNVFAVETNSGAVHYYVIADKSTETDLTVLPVLYNGAVQLLPETELDLGTYTLTSEIEKFSDETETYALILAVYADGKLQSVGFAEKALEFGTNVIKTTANLGEFGETSTEIKALAWNGMNTAAPYIEPVIWNNVGE